MRIVRIKILAEDIRTSDYTKTSDCAMTRAFKRANLDMRECGGQILKGSESFSSFEFIMNTPSELNNKVIAMYKYVAPYKNYENTIDPMEPQDFEFDLNLPDNYEK